MSINDQYEKPEPADWHHSAIGRVRHALKVALNPETTHSHEKEWLYPRFWDDLAELLTKVERKKRGPHGSLEILKYCADQCPTCEDHNLILDKLFDEMPEARERWSRIVEEVKGLG